MSRILILKENNNFNKTKNTLLNPKKYQLNYKKILEKSKLNQRVKFLQTQSTSKNNNNKLYMSRKYSTEKKKLVKLKFEEIVSPEKLKSAWYRLKSNPGMLTHGTSKETLNKIKDSWFGITSGKLIKGEFRYPLQRRINIPKPIAENDTRPITITNPRVKIIERAFLDSLEPIFEGAWSWQEITKKEYEKLKSNPKIPNNDLKSKKTGYFMKNWSYKPIFDSASYGFRPNKSCHQALYSVKHWKTNTVWVLDYDVRKAFDNVNRAQLENIFKQYIDCPPLWNEIIKMMDVGIVNPDLFFETKGTSQGNILSPFLFNVYMNEFDKFMRQLSIELPQPEEFTNDQVLEATREYRNIERTFSSERIAQTIKRYGSVERMHKALKQRKKEYYQKWGRSEGNVQATKNFIHYIRYADDFIVGIGGSKKLAEEVRGKIDSFLQNNLYLEVKQNQLVNRNSGAVKFLGFLIYLSKFRRKTRIKWKKFSSLAKYRKRVIARLSKADARLAKAAVHSIKKNMIRAFRQRLEAKNKNFNKKNLFLTSSEIAHELNYKSRLDNPALYRWEKHFAKLFKIDQSLALKIYHKQVSALSVPEEGEYEYYIKLKSLRDKFIEDIEKIESDAKESIIEKRKATIDKVKKKHILGLVAKPSPSWVNFSEEMIYKASAVLTQEFLNQKQVRRIGINAPLKTIIEKLASKKFYHFKRKKPIGNPSLSNLSDVEIIQCYSNMMNGLLNYYRPADNFSSIKSVVEGLRRSCALSLAIKHKKNLKWSYHNYGLDIKVDVGDRTFSLPTIKTLSDMDINFLIKEDTVGLDIDNILKKYKSRLRKGGQMFSQCAVSGCYNSDIEIHHIRKLSRKVEKDGKTSVLNRAGRRVKGSTALLSAMNRKQLPLCSMHHILFERGEFSDLDTTFLNKIYNTKIPDNTVPRQVFTKGELKKK